MGDQLKSDDVDPMSLMGAIGSWFTGGAQSEHPRASETPPLEPEIVEKVAEPEIIEEPLVDDDAEEDITVEEMVIQDALEEVLGKSRRRRQNHLRHIPCPRWGLTL